MLTWIEVAEIASDRLLNLHSLSVGSFEKQEMPSAKTFQPQDITSIQYTI